MTAAFYVTLQAHGENQEVHIISPEYWDFEDAALFLAKIVQRLILPSRFKMDDDAGCSYSTDSHLLKVVKDVEYTGIPLLNFNETTLDHCFVFIQDYFDSLTELKGQE